MRSEKPSDQDPLMTANTPVSSSFAARMDHTRRSGIPSTMMIRVGSDSPWSKPQPVQSVATSSRIWNPAGETAFGFAGRNRTLRACTLVMAPSAEQKGTIRRYPRSFQSPRACVAQVGSAAPLGIARARSSWATTAGSRSRLESHARTPVSSRTDEPFSQRSWTSSAGGRRGTESRFGVLPFGRRRFSRHHCRTVAHRASPLGSFSPTTLWATSATESPVMPHL